MYDLDKFRTKDTDLGFSVITNFGCKNNCSYCIWKNFHPLKDTFTTYESTDWKRLEDLISVYPGRKINISGGGDPLFEYENNKNWWGELFDIAKRNKKLVDIHTREFLYNEDLLSNINKMVLSFDTLHPIKDKILKYKSYGLKIRLVKVITAETNIRTLRNIIEFSNENGFQTTFKELYGFDDKSKFKTLQEKLKKEYNFELNAIRFLENKDYNLYFMPDNKLWDSFMIRDYNEKYGYQLLHESLVKSYYAGTW